MTDWQLIRQKKQMQVNKDTIHENINQVDQNYAFVYKSFSIITLHKNIKRHIRAHL